MPITKELGAGSARDQERGRSAKSNGGEKPANGGEKPANGGNKAAKRDIHSFVSSEPESRALSIILSREHLLKLRAQ